MVTMLSRGLVAAMSLATLGTPAQTPPQNGRPDPLDAKASVPAVNYRSSLPGLRTADADKPVPWREANDIVTRIGGWRSYAREAQEPMPAASAPTPATPASAPAAGAKPADRPLTVMPGHSGHSGHKAP